MILRLTPNLEPGRVLAIDYGLRRCGLAVTDPEQRIATPLDTVDTPGLLDYLERYARQEPLSALVLGRALHADGSETPVEQAIQVFLKALSLRLPALVVYRHDEHGSSRRAAQVILQSGVKQKQRRDKALTDRISAAIILQEFMGFI